MKIGFKNFKKFKDFPMIELAPITFLVGPNNSGKSSFIKALTFLFFNLRNQQKGLLSGGPLISQVSFNHNTLSHYAWGDFESFLHKEYKEGHFEENFNHNITFLWEDHNNKFEFSFGASVDEIRLDPSLLVTLPVNSFYVYNKDWQISFNSYLENDEWNQKIVFKTEKCIEWLRECISWLDGHTPLSELKIKDMDSYLEFTRLPKNSIENSDFYKFRSQRLIDWYKEGIKEIEISGKDEIEFDLEYQNAPLYHSISDFIGYISYILGFGSSTLKKEICPDFSYIETHNPSYNFAYSTFDKNDYLAQTLAQYYSLRQKKKLNGINPDVWVTEWLKNRFHICDNFYINPPIGGEIYTVDISKGKTLLASQKSLMPLSTLGTGAIQIFTLLLKISSELLILNERILSSEPLIIIVEEPEQNLHPALQSQLADLFLEVYKLSGGRIRFVVETHSEYLIRRTQIKVAEQFYKTDEELLKDNPFKVYYFPNEGLPYDMKYRLDGCFEELFGTGFFDEGSNLAFKLFGYETDN